MPVIIQIPTALRQFADGQPEISAEGSTAGDVIAAFAERYPDIKRHLYDEYGALRSFINVFLGENNIKNLEGPATPVKDGDVLILVPAIAGGTGKSA
ncbi:MAG: MoaD/ThiS family protein [Synergistaceae bacterium]|jgi:molybdopterin converting factor small subunit|nr:MoaD/ThiS family protein [Synergistaceae bacterium]